MSKLRDQLSINDRLRQYIERMLTVIIETSPQLLEVTASCGVSIDSMETSSSISTENKSPLPETSTPTESIKSDSSATAVKKKPADNS